MAIAGRRVFEWDDGALDRRFALRPVVVGLAAGGPSFRETVARLELPAKSAFAGSLAALLYVTPVLFAVKIFVGFGSRLFAAVIGAGALVGTVASWAISAWERRHWEARRGELSDYAEPPPWR
jgi:hypothetical protein